MRVVDVDWRALNSIANDPDVLVMIDPEARSIDLSWMYDEPGVLVKGCEGVTGAVAFLPHQGARYELHYFMPGNAGLPAIRAIIDWVFTRTNTQAIFGFTPTSNLSARLVNTWLGASVVGTKTDGAGRPCKIYELTREQWASKLGASACATMSESTEQLTRRSTRK